jgi:hypothetical protein
VVLNIAAMYVLIVTVKTRKIEIGKELQNTVRNYKKKSNEDK